MRSLWRPFHYVHLSLLEIVDHQERRMLRMVVMLEAKGTAQSQVYFWLLWVFFQNLHRFSLLLLPSTLTRFTFFLLLCFTRTDQCIEYNVEFVVKTNTYQPINCQCYLINGKNNLLNFKMSVRMGKMVKESDLKLMCCGWLLVSGRLNLTYNISLIAELLGFSLWTTEQNPLEYVLMSEFRMG